MDEIFENLTDLCFSLLMSYVGALEFIIILRHLVHWSGRHSGDDENDAENLKLLKEKLRREIEAATEREQKADGNKAMQDGVLYKDGFRIDPQKAEIERLKAEIENIEARQKRRAEMEAELKRQRKIKEETKKQLERAEAELAEQRAKVAEEEKQRKQQAEAEQAREEAEQLRRLLEAEKQREAEQREKEEEAEQLRRLLEAEKQREIEQRQKEEEAEQLRRLLEAEKQREIAQKQEEEATENSRRILENERQREAEQRDEEESAISAQQILAAEQQREEQKKQAEEERKSSSNVTRKFLEAEKQHDSDDESENDNNNNNEFTPAQLKLKRENKQKLIEENARKFLEAEEEMVQLQQKMLESAKVEEEANEELTPVFEEPIMKRSQTNIAADFRPKTGETPTTTVKTQFGQGSSESFTLTTKPLLFPGISDDASSNEPNSSKQSSFSTQPSEEFTTTGTEDITQKTTIGLQIPQHERQEPDGEDNAPQIQYDEEYLRSLDGIKQRPLFREDGSGRRRAFKKRRSSGSSNSSRDSRTSREEELKMFTSLEEEELNSSHKTDEDFTPIKYTNEPTLKVKSHHHHHHQHQHQHRRHKRSPAKDSRTPEENLRTSLEMLGEESTNPWGEVIPEHYKDTEFWRREKAMSIDEEEIELELPTTGEQEAELESEINQPKSSSFEEATHKENENAILTLKNQNSKDTETQVTQHEEQSNDNDNNSTENENRSNLQTSYEREDNASPARSSASPRLRRSPRIDEIDQYEVRWKETEEVADSFQNRNQPKTPTTPKINVQAAAVDATPWRDEYGLMMQGLSDFYDFTASINPSRSRDASRNASPVSSQPSSPLPKDVSFNFDMKSAPDIKLTNKIFDVYDDTADDGNVGDNVDVASTKFDFYDDTTTADVGADGTTEFDVYDDTGNCSNIENITALIESLHVVENLSDSLEFHNDTDTNDQYVNQTMANDKNEIHEEIIENNFLPTICIESTEKENPLVENCQTNENMNNLVQTLREQRIRSRSRSRSPLPSRENLERSLDNRRTKLIKHNEEILEKLTKETTENLPENESCIENPSRDDMSKLVESLRVDRRRSRSHSPLPTMDNIERSLENRRSKLIQHNDELFEKINDKIEDSSSNQRENDEPKDKTVDIAKEEMNQLIASLRVDRRRSRSRSPLPTMDNIERSLENRRSKLIQHNDELFQKLGDKAEDSSSNQMEDVEGKDQTVDTAKEEMNQLVASLRLNQQRSRSRSPMPTINLGKSIKVINQDQIENREIKIEKEESKEEMNSLIDSLRADRRRSRSRSPLPTMDNVQRSLETRRNKLIQHNDELHDKLIPKTEIIFDSPIIMIESIEEAPSKENQKPLEEVDKEMSNLVATLRAARSRSRSRTPMRTLNDNIIKEHLNEAQYIYETANDDDDDDHFYRSRTPSRSQSPQIFDDNDFHRLLNLESSQNRTLSKESEERESIYAEKQRNLDAEALYHLKTAKEETELRMLTPTDLLRDSNICGEYCLAEENSSSTEDDDKLADLPAKQRLQKLRCTPTTPDYDRTISEEWRDVQRIKNEMIASGFKRSTYVGESMEFGSDYEQLRLETAHFRRSNSPSPSFSEESQERHAKQSAAEKRRIQENILNELIACSGSNDENKNGAKPKTERRYSEDYAYSLSKEINDTQRIKQDQLNSGFKRSKYVGESVDMNAACYEDMRREMATFQRSLSRSRSPIDEQANFELAAIEAEAIRRKIQDRILDNLSNVAPSSFQDFSRNLNIDFLDDRRASDSALIQRTDLLDFDIEPEEYHHYRRFSLNQEQPIEEYPDDNYIYVSEIEVETPNGGTRTWIREDYYSENFPNIQREQRIDQENMAAEYEHIQEIYEIAHEDDETDGSEDERQTVVEVDDEIDTDICDYNERGPTDESHHEQSECEEAERAMDHYAGLEAADWHEVSDVSDIIQNNRIRNDDEGAVGGTDSDSFTIDQIYDDAIKNRKQSGILREYDSILLEMQKSYERNNFNDNNNDKENYALWAKTRALERADEKGKMSIANFIEAEKRDTEIRYLGDAKLTARQATRLRSRYGYVPILKNHNVEEVDIDLNYKPKREYNWRKNFKLDDEREQNNVEKNGSYEIDEYFEIEYAREGERESVADAVNEHDVDFDERKYSLGGESITLFSRSPEKEIWQQTVLEERIEDEIKSKESLAESIIELNNDSKEMNGNSTLVEKPKKKKSKKKTLRGSKEKLERTLSKDEDDSDNQIYSRRSSSIQMETDSPKRKSRSRRSSRSSITNEDSNTLFSPRSSVGFVDEFGGNTILNNGDLKEPLKKKIKKRKKVKESFSTTHDIKEEQEQPEFIQPPPAPTASAVLTPESASLNMLAILSPQNSVCVTPASTESEKSEKPEKIENSQTQSQSQKVKVKATAPTTMPTPATTATSTPTSYEAFDILKDANFYPLF